MTTTPLLAVDLKDAAKAVRSLVGVVLDNHDVTLAEWVALRMLDVAPGRVSQPALRDGLVLALDVDAAEATALLCSLEGRGLLCYDAFEQAGLTVAGAALFGEIGAGVAAITDEVYVGIDASELATTRRVLASVAARASELRSRL